MTHEAPTPISTAPDGSAPDGSGGEAATPSRTPPWLPIVTSVLCIGLMGLVLALATADRDDEEHDPTSADPRGPRPTDTELYGHPERGGMRTPPAGAFAGCGELDPSKPPRIELVMDDRTLDLGDLKQGVRLTRQVTFKSTGVGPLCVVSVKSSCGCLKASLEGTQRIYAPGESGAIRLAVDTTGRMGVINKRVTITCNDPKAPLTSFHVKMDINAGLMSDPQYLQFGNVTPGASASRAVFLRTKKDDTSWKVTGVRSARRVEGIKPVKYTYEVQEVEDPRYRRVKVRILHPGHETTGSYHDKVVIETTHPDRPEVVVRAHIHVVPRIVFRARIISLGFVRAGAPRAPTRARIQAGAPGIEFAITGVAVEPPSGGDFGPGGVPFLVEHGKDAKGWWIEVKYDGKPRKAGLIKGVVVVSTDDASQPELRIPVRATLQPAR